MRPATTVRVTALAVCGLYSAILHYTGVSVGSQARTIIGWLPLMASLSLVAWDLFLWRLPGLQRLTRRPRLDGLWRVELEPTRESHIPVDGNRGPIPAFLVVRQTFWSLHVRQYTVESISDSIAHVWTGDGGSGCERVAFIYDNTPAAKHEHRSHRHLGTCQLDPTSHTPTSMSGVYFTDRYTKGDMTLNLVDRSKEHPSFNACSQHVQSVPTSGNRRPKGELPPSN
jgi:SMODS-associating 2TM, beta-strand rich effector domain